MPDPTATPMSPAPQTEADLDLRRLDALVAEKVMGWQLVERPIPGTHDPVTMWPEWYDAQGKLWHGGNLSFTRRWDAAGQVVERQVGRGLYFDLRVGGREIDTDPVWTAKFLDYFDPEEEARAFVGRAHTAPLAICLAALKALGVTEVPERPQTGLTDNAEVNDHSEAIQP